jgi:hypothetical protein
MTASIRLVAVSSLLVAAAACGSDDDSVDGNAADSPAATQSTPGDAAESDAAETSDADETSDSDDAAEAPGGSGGGTATLTLANGEVFEFSGVLCSLEPQMAAGSEILFSATSYDDPGLDITQFGDTGTITGIASISVYDGNYETLWDANSMLGTDVELTLDGSTIRGTGNFVEGEDYGGETVEGEVVANC